MWAILVVRESGDNPCAWYVTEGETGKDPTQHPRDVSQLPCYVNAVREGERMVQQNKHAVDYARVLRYDPRALGELASCRGPDLTGLTGWLGNLGSQLDAGPATGQDP